MNAKTTHTFKALLIAAIVGLFGVALALTAASPASAGSGGVSAQEDSSGTRVKQVNNRYSTIWKTKVTRRNKRWAHRVAACESGKNPKAIGGGGSYRGAFQFMRQTWKRAPKSPGGDPIRFSYRTQAVVAVALKRDAGTSPWPSCG